MLSKLLKIIKGEKDKPLGKNVEDTWGPTIDYDRCKNCASCYNFCKYGVYAIENGRVVVKNKSNCIEGCSLCLDVCRYGALSFPDHKT
ncbi:ATP-binding protein [Methanocaldococcus vulcanius]|uniref:ATP-binding protein n=1 Tax=Methanocaldococcus vulcanius TaxID=73913 RepID=UPI0001B0F9A2|nr:ferredoxin family protein [Methanocaldococcus vulcanius]